MKHLDNAFEAGMKGVALIPEIIESEELDQDIALCELLSLVCYFTIEAYNDITEYFKIMSDILFDHPMTIKIYEEFKATLNSLLRNN